MPRLAQYLGRWILHSGWYPDRKVRLFDRRQAKWVGDFVHESVVVEGRVGHLDSNLLHFTCIRFPTSEDHGPLYYSGGRQLVAQETLSAGRNWHRPPWTFFKTYFLQRGFLDGRRFGDRLHGGAL